MGQVLTHEIELMSGFADDVQNILDKVVDAFAQSRSVGFEHFSAVWREMEFSLVSSDFLFWRHDDFPISLSLDENLFASPPHTFSIVLFNVHVFLVFKK